MTTQTTLTDLQLQVISDIKSTVDSLVMHTMPDEESEDNPYLDMLALRLKEMTSLLCQDLDLPGPSATATEFERYIKEHSAISRDEAA